MSMGGPVIVLNRNSRGEKSKSVQLANIEAGKTVADVVRTCLGPRAMLKMLMDPMGGIVMTNDGNAILREITVEHPAAKSMIEIARTQDEEVGDGTTSVIILGKYTLLVNVFKVVKCSLSLLPALKDKFIQRKLFLHLEKAWMTCSLLYAITSGIHVTLSNCCKSIPVDTNNKEEMFKVIKSCVGTKFINQWADLACQIALDAVKTVTIESDGRKEIDIKRYAKIEKIPGGSTEDSVVMDGVMFNKDVVHPRMSRKIENPRILLLDCNLEYKKGESQTSIEISNEKDFTRALEIEENYIKEICDNIIKYKPDVVITEKGVSDLAQHFLAKAGISVLRRLRKTDNFRIARATGATIVSRPEEIKEDDIGTQAGLFEVKTIGDEYFTFITKCKNPKACTILLRGASKDVLNEVERNLQDAMNVARNVMLDQRLVPGGGAIEMALGQVLTEKARSAVSGVQQMAYLSMAQALEVIPRTLAKNCGANVLRLITELRARHAIDPAKYWTLGVDGTTGKLADMKELNVWDPLVVKSQTFKTSIETAILLLRIDDVVSGVKKQGGDTPTNAAPAAE
ncbi:T-complex protein 1 subunit gamma [Paragonimus heterotremus]|uniref:T-complex protein 1 subunit gamma n=1 Tax=Paragonimus heterotremus TaxID=100268 RepID=A0A8J4T6C6_9TREM|nr:T-complex protein 1 subunit gamma [Paragonimus heterotremus]